MWLVVVWGRWHRLSLTALFLPCVRRLQEDFEARDEILKANPCLDLRYTCSSKVVRAIHQLWEFSGKRQQLQLPRSDPRECRRSTCPDSASPGHKHLSSASVDRSPPTVADA